MFNIFITHLCDGADYTLSKFPEDVKLRRVADTPGGHVAIQRDLNRLQKRADLSLIQFSKGKCKLLYLEWKKPMDQYVLGHDQLENIFAEKDWGS